MASDFAPLLRSIWGDDDWRALTADAQHLYLMLLSSPSRNSAGVVPLTVRRWSKQATGLTSECVREALAELDDASFLVVDEETEEVLVRAFIRRAKVYQHVRMFVNALREVSEVESERLRSALGQELVRLPKLAVPESNTRMKGEAEAAQDRLDELASMLCDAPPDPPPHGMAHGMNEDVAQGIAHPPVVGTGAVAFTGTGAVLGFPSRERSSSLEGDARARDPRPDSSPWRTA